MERLNQINFFPKLKALQKIKTMLAGKLSKSLCLHLLRVRGLGEKLFPLMRIKASGINWLELLGAQPTLEARQWEMSLIWYGLATGLDPFTGSCSLGALVINLIAHLAVHTTLPASIQKTVLITTALTITGFVIGMLVAIVVADFDDARSHGHCLLCYCKDPLISLSNLNGNKNATVED